MLLLVATLATSQAAPTTTSPSVTRAGADITAFDCHQPTQMQTEPAAERCGRAPPLTVSGQAVLVQELTIQKTRGWTCEMKRSKHAYYCGMLSYETELFPIEFLHAQQVHPRECRRWVHEHTFIDPDRQAAHQIRVPGVTQIQVTAVGQGGNIVNKVTCQGGTLVTVDGRAQTGIVEEFEYQITVRKINIVKIGTEVEAGAHHLPCQFKHGRCVAGNFETYIWNATKTCPLRKLSQGAAFVTESQLVMPEHNIELSIAAAAAELNVTSCPPLQLRQTEVAHVYAAVGPVAAQARHLLDAPAPAEVDPQLDTAVRLRTADHQIRRLRRGQQPGCQASEQQIIALQPPRFGAVRGDAFVTFNCTAVAAKLRVTRKCYEDIPVYLRHEDEQLFVEAGSRRLKTTSAAVPCSQLWPTLVQGGQAWWSLPALERVPAVTAEARGDPVSDALYTAQQLDDWRRAVTFPDEKETVPSVLAAGLCKQPEGCPWLEHADSTFSLHRLESNIEGGLDRLIIPEPFASMLLHFQTITTIVVWCMAIAWCRQLCRTGADRHATQVKVELQPPPAAAVAGQSTGQRDALSRALDHHFRMAESRL